LSISDPLDEFTVIEEVFLTPFVSVEVPAEFANNISNTPELLVTSVYVTLAISGLLLKSL